MVRVLSAPLTIVLALITAARSEAQPAATARNITLPSVNVGVAAGVGNLDDSSEFDGPVFAASLQMYLTPHFGITAESSRIRRSLNFVSPGYHITAPSGAQGFSGTLTTIGSDTEWTAGVGVVLRTRPGRVSVFGTSGVLLLVRQRRETVRSEGCIEPATSFGYQNFCEQSFPANFTDIDHTWSYQFGPGIDVKVIGPLLAYAHMQYVLNSDYRVRFIAGGRFILH